ncbi:hypothetical protein MSAN_00886500 [Mycena sanguinolenta]|uniref:Uncharacterized protein n=1 Tax=Mycena sanguinolenta TaxID=230812 RepID=A0A8H6YSC2_9AGAR|nr:hypothetical protein MSAN_00886500 [Mycena sanguinolenta]
MFPSSSPDLAYVPQLFHKSQIHVVVAGASPREYILFFGAHTSLSPVSCLRSLSSSSSSEIRTTKTNFEFLQIIVIRELAPAPITAQDDRSALVRVLEPDSSLASARPSNNFIHIFHNAQ